MVIGMTELEMRASLLRAQLLMGAAQITHLQALVQLGTGSNLTIGVRGQLIGDLIIMGWPGTGHKLVRASCTPQRTIGGNIPAPPPLIILQNFRIALTTVHLTISMELN